MLHAPAAHACCTRLLQSVRTSGDGTPALGVLLGVEFDLGVLGHMAKITFIAYSGEQHEVEAQNGLSLMVAAVDNLVPGIDADCGGECSCATCHVIVTDEWFAKTGGPSDAENAMLDLSQEREATSRLSCQVEVSDELDGLVVKIPEYQI